MKQIIFAAALLFAMTATAQKQPKQYKSAETGRYVSKSTADKSPSTTYSTPRKSSSSGSTTATTSRRSESTTNTSSSRSSKSKS